MNHKHNVPLP